MILVPLPSAVMAPDDSTGCLWDVAESEQLWYCFGLFHEWNRQGSQLSPHSCPKPPDGGSDPASLLDLPEYRGHLQVQEKYIRLEKFCLSKARDAVSESIQTHSCETIYLKGDKSQGESRVLFWGQIISSWFVLLSSASWSEHVMHVVLCHITGSYKNSLEPRSQETSSKPGRWRAVL